MSPAPLVSIVVPVHNDEGTIEAALASCLAQTLREIEVVCVDDASDDGTVAVIERMQRQDGRIRLIRHETTRSALQARRSGVTSARGEAVLFLDGDDELDSRAAEASLAAMRASVADLVQFDVTVIDRHGRSGGTYEQRLAPRHTTLTGSDIMRELFAPGAPAQGQLWRYLFHTDLLRRAYAHIPADLVLIRVNDLPLMFLVATLAEHFVSIDEKLYRYHLGRGGSGHDVDTMERAEFYATAIDSVDSIRDAVASISATARDPETVQLSYRATRQWILGYVCLQLIERAAPGVLDAAVAHLRSKANDQELLAAAAAFSPRSLSALSRHVSHASLTGRNVRTILLATSSWRTGGVAAVLAAQAGYLSDAGYRVIVVARSAGTDLSLVPAEIEFVELAGGDLPKRLAAWAELCRERGVDLVIDHQMFYTRYWPEFAAMARAHGVPTIGWLHNFVARPLLDRDDRLRIIERHADILAHVVVLSPLDVAYLKLRGIAHASFIPNPPSAMLSRDRPAAPKDIRKGPLRLIWWGRLEEGTKRTSELIEVAANLRRQREDFTLTVIGPDWEGYTAAKFNAAARRRGVGQHVQAVGPLRGKQLLSAIDEAHAFVTTSIIEGYQLTIAEAQSRGLPVFMYELPWLTLVQGNGGIVAVAQADAAGLAAEIARVAADPVEYAQLSEASLVAADRAAALDVALLTRNLVAGGFNPEFSPEPTLEDAKTLLGLLRFYAEAGAATMQPAPAADSWIGARLWRSVAPLGRRALGRFPALRPIAHRVKKRLGITG
ncbi:MULTISPECIES: glycosyltransferase [unclassified Microbacterium]|uniref:glycosyltransferase n=1 Tax=unclassified Microbacterium TaxID=2609290 RepID=UPI003C2B37A9